MAEAARKAIEANDDSFFDKKFLSSKEWLKAIAHDNESDDRDEFEEALYAIDYTIHGDDIETVKDEGHYDDLLKAIKKFRSQNPDVSKQIPSW